MTKPVGRPPNQLDIYGKKVLSAPISVNIPIRMVEWIGEKKHENPKFNVSKYITDLIQKSMDDGMCPNCYGTNLLERSIGLSCEDCTAKRMASEPKFNINLVHYVSYYKCDNCNTPLDLWNKRAYFGGNATKKNISGCQVCARIPFEEDEAMEEAIGDGPE